MHILSLSTLLWCACNAAGFQSDARPAAQSAQPPKSDEIDWPKAQKFWSFRKPVPYVRPYLKDKTWPRQPLDYFILQRLERAKLQPSPEADRRVLIRRLTFDLTGLPPTPEEVTQYMSDRSYKSYESLVERLLASPRFGERMASMWLPLARFADDQAHQVGDDTKFFYPNAFKYRDWLIGAFNRDLPYDRFIKLQLAGDHYLGIRPTGAKEVVEESLPKESSDAKSAKATDPADLAALGFLGLGPKYYNRNILDVMADEWEDRVDTVTRTFLGLTVSCARCHNHKFDPITTEDYYALAGIFASTKMINRTPDGMAEKGGITADKMNPATLHVVEDGTPTNLNVFYRGNVNQKGPMVPRRFLRVLCASEPQPFKDGSGRAELAESIANRANPLTARVLVNRVWGTMFGRPLVSTPSNFGHMGTMPSHPELLDDLAVRFMDNGWSVKSLVKEVVLSSTYRQASLATEKGKAIDAPNFLLGRMNRRRLTVEQWRDSALFVTGELTDKGPNTTDLDDLDNHRRTVCARISRLRLNDMLALFDYPDANVHSEKRSVTTTPTQKLFILNSPFMLARAKALAARLTSNQAETDPVRIQRAYNLLYGRDADQKEMNLALAFLKNPAAQGMSRWEQYAQMLLASNEMLYVD